MSQTEKIIKRLFDIFFSLVALFLTGWLILLLVLIIYLENKESGWFIQTRFGQFGKPFNIYKIKTMQTILNKTDIQRITPIGKILRKTKLDELPQFWNVLKGDMSFVGPRPDYLSLLDDLKEEDKIILSLKPGLTGPAQLIFMNEEKILTNQPNPEKYNKEVIWPKKVEINKKYVKEYSLFKDFEYIFKTLFSL